LEIEDPKGETKRCYHLQRREKKARRDVGNRLNRSLRVGQDVSKEYWRLEKQREIEMRKRIVGNTLAGDFKKKEARKRAVIRSTNFTTFTKPNSRSHFQPRRRWEIRARKPTTGGKDGLGEIDLRQTGMRRGVRATKKEKENNSCGAWN